MVSSPINTTWSQDKSEKTPNIVVDGERDLEAGSPPPNHLRQWRVPDLADRWSRVLSIGQFDRSTSQVRNDESF